MTYRLTEWGASRMPVPGVEPWGEMSDREYRRLCVRFPWLPERGYFERVPDVSAEFLAGVDEALAEEAAGAAGKTLEEIAIDDDSAEASEVIGGRTRTTRRGRTTKEE